MSVLMEFAMFPTDKGASVSEYVSKVIEMISKTTDHYKLTAMGTIVETETMDEALDVLKKSYMVLEPYADRIYSSVNFDIRKQRSNRLEGKIASVKKKIGDINT